MYELGKLTGELVRITSRVDFDLHYRLTVSDAVSDGEFSSTRQDIDVSTSNK